MKKKLLFFLILFWANTILLKSQNYLSQNYLNIDIERCNIDSGGLHYTVKPFDNKLYRQKKANNTYTGIKKTLNDNLFEKRYNNSLFIVNPNIQYLLYNSQEGKALYSFFGGGFSIKSEFFEKVFIEGNIFASRISLSDNLQMFAKREGYIPHFGKYFNNTDNVYDFFNIEGKIEYKPTDFANFEIGKSRNFLGAGHRSLLLSENSNSYPYFKAKINVGKIEYLWLISKLTDRPFLGSNAPAFVLDKLTFTHYLSVNFFKRINFNFFESIISSPYDIDYKYKGYNLSYFNPVIFYRPVEFSNGTADNAMLGAGLNIRILKKTILYSQFLLDDLIIAELKAGSGWWGNKFGYQLGVKTYNFFSIKDLFFLGEYNVISPYTYSHYTANINYGNFGMPLTHPEGANLKELISQVQYKKNRFIFNIKVSLLEKGIDNEDSVSYGGDIYKSYELRIEDYGVQLLQGDKYQKIEFNPEFNYLINEKMNFHFKFGYRYLIEKIDQEKKEFSLIIFGISTSFWGNNSDYLK